ncbi:MAG: autotransporter-associated beta strand repeat-containing protein [bacterium]
MNTRRVEQVTRKAGAAVLGLSVLGLWLLPQDVQAGSKYWDTDAASGLQTGAGNWDTGSTALWSTTSSGTALTTWSDSDSAYFQTGGSNAVTIAAGTTNLANSLTITTANTILNLSGGTLSLPGNMTVSGGRTENLITSSIIGAITGDKNWTVNTDTSITIGGGVTITGSSGYLYKLGAGTLVLSSPSAIFENLRASGGTVKLDSSVTGNPTVTANSRFYMGDTGSVATSPVRVLMNAGSLGGTATFGIGYTGYGIFTATNGIIGPFGETRIAYSGRGVFNLGGTAAFSNAPAGIVMIANYGSGHGILNCYGNSTLACGTMNIGGRDDVNNGYGYGVLSVADSASVTCTTFRVGYNQNGGDKYCQFNLTGGRVSVGGSTINLAQSQSSPYILQGSINLAGGRLSCQRILNGTGRGRLNFHGGTLAYSGTSTQTDFINLASGNGRAVVYEGATIDTATQNVTIAQALLGPAGSGVTSIPVSSQGSGYWIPPAVKIVNNASDTTGSGATAVAQVDANSGAITNILMTNPGTDYTLTPTVTLDMADGGSGASLGTVMIGANSGYTGGLTKVGSGTLTLSGTNTYVGATVVSNGTLRLTHAQALSTNTTVVLATGALLNLDFYGTNVVRSLQVGAEVKPRGFYDKNKLPGIIVTGNGVLQTQYPLPGGTLIVLW